MSRNRIVLILAVFVVTALAAPATVGAAPTGGDEAAVASATAAECGFPFTSTDATGNEVTVEEEPESVITLGPGATQTMYEIGAEDKIVGATALSSYFPDYDSWADVSETQNGRTQVSVEKVIAEDPDLVIAENIVGNETVSALRDAGITVYKFDRATSLEFVYGKVHTTGALVGSHQAAADAVADIQYEVEVARQAAQSSESPRALYVFFGFTSGSNTFIDEIITTAGGTNVATEAGISGYREISDEVVAEQRVEWLLLNSGNPQVPDREAYQQTVAVQNDQTAVLNANNISQPAPRIAQPIRQLSRTWYPDAHEEARQSVERPDVRPPCAPEPTTTAVQGTTATEGGANGTTAQTTAAGTTAAATTAESDDGGSPGFSVGAAAVAALVALLVARRRR